MTQAIKNKCLSCHLFLLRMKLKPGEAASIVLNAFRARVVITRDLYKENQGNNSNKWTVMQLVQNMINSDKIH